MNTNNNLPESFRYTYSAQDQEELKRIRSKYLDECEAEDKMARVRRLVANVTKKGTVWSLIVGIVGTLIMGTGMCLAMEVLGGGTLFMILGIVVGLVGMGIAAIAYPLYKRITERERRRVAPEILRLTSELIK